MQRENAKETLRFTMEVLTACHDAMDLALKNLHSAQQTLGTKRLTAHTIPCGWIPQAKKMAHVPYYLWDKRGQRTVCTETFMYLPEYTVVRHT